MRYLHQQSGSVAGGFVGTGCPAMVHIQENLQTSPDDVVRRNTFNVSNKTNPAVFMFVCRIVQTLSFR
jgi:hypothetical protein